MHVHLHGIKVTDLALIFLSFFLELCLERPGVLVASARLIPGSLLRQLYRPSHLLLLAKQLLLLLAKLCTQYKPTFYFRQGDYVFTCICLALFFC